MPKDDELSAIAPGDGESILVMTDLVTIKLRGRGNAGPFVLTEVSTPSQGGPPMLHRHADQETFYVVEGLFRFDTLQDGEPAGIQALPGSVVHIPGQVWHNYKNIGASQGRLMVLLQPGDMIDFFREMGVPVTDKTNLPRPSGPPDMQRVLEIMKKHQVEMLGAPLPV